MSVWSEDRKFVLASLDRNERDHEKLESKLDRILENTSSNKLKLASIYALLASPGIVALVKGLF
jgi:hypothetical protein